MISGRKESYPNPCRCKPVSTWFSVDCLLDELGTIYNLLVSSLSAARLVLLRIGMGVIYIERHSSWDQGLSQRFRTLLPDGGDAQIRGHPLSKQDACRRTDCVLFQITAWTTLCLLLRCPRTHQILNPRFPLRGTHSWTLAFCSHLDSSRSRTEIARARRSSHIKTVGLSVKSTDRRLGSFGYTPNRSPSPADGPLARKAESDKQTVLLLARYRRANSSRGGIESSFEG